MLSMNKWCTKDKVEKLPDSAKNLLVMELQNHNEKLAAENAKLVKLIETQNEIIRLKSTEPYIPSSEQTAYLFDEMELLADMVTDNDTKEVTVKEHKRKVSHKIKELPENTPITVVDHTKNAPDTYTAENGYVYKRTDDKVVDKIGFIPAKYYLERHLYPQYSLKDFEPEKEERRTIVLWENEKTDVLSAAPSLIAKTVIKKYADALPLYRQEAIFKREGVEISRQTLSNWLLKYSELLNPLKERFKYYLLKSPLINQDETPVQVLHLEKSKPSKTHFMFVRVGTACPDTGKERVIVQYTFIANRKIETLSQDSDLYNSYIMTDGLRGYLGLDKHLNCWVHAVRGIKKYLKINKKSSDARHITAIVGKLYIIEKDLRKKYAADKITRAEFISERKTETQKVFEELKQFLDKTKGDYTPRSPMGTAINYFYTYWDSLIRYPECFESSPDNNRAENSIRPFTLGRKNWLFCVSEAGADASAMYYSLIETAKANKLNTFDYVWYIMMKAPSCKTDADWDQLMPWAVTEDNIANLHETRDRAKPDPDRTKKYIIRGSRR